jgi:hypothetical protein
LMNTVRVRNIVDGSRMSVAVCGPIWDRM